MTSCHVTWLVIIPFLNAYQMCTRSQQWTTPGRSICKCSTEYHVLQKSSKLAEGAPTKLTSQCKCTAYTYELTDSQLKCIT